MGRGGDGFYSRSNSRTSWRSDVAIIGYRRILRKAIADLQTAEYLLLIMIFRGADKGLYQMRLHERMATSQSGCWFWKTQGMPMGCFNLNSYKKQVIEKIKVDGIETVRAVFVDQHGILRGKTIVSSALETAFDSGIKVPSTLLLKDTSHRTVFPIWSNNSNLRDLPLHGASDVVLRPTPERFHPVPWSPHSAFILCSVEDQNGKPISFSSDEVLSVAVNALKNRLHCCLWFKWNFKFSESESKSDPRLATMPPASVARKSDKVINTLQRFDMLRWKKTLTNCADVQRLGLEPGQLKLKWDQANLNLRSTQLTQRRSRSFCSF